MDVPSVSGKNGASISNLDFVTPPPAFLVHSRWHGSIAGNVYTLRLSKRKRADLLFAVSDLA